MGKKSNRTASPSAVYCRVQGPGYGPAGAAAFLTLIFLTLIFLTLIFNSRCPHQGAANIMYTCSLDRGAGITCGILWLLQHAQSACML